MKVGKKFFILGLVCVSLILGNIISARANDWAYFGYTAKNNRYTTDIGPQTNVLDFKITVGHCDYIPTGVMISQDTGYFTDTTGRVWALNLKNPRQMRWVTQISDEPYFYSPVAPLIAGNTLFVTNNRKIYALGLEDGEIKNSFELPEFIMGLTYYEQNLYLLSGGWEAQTLTAMNVATGEVKWQSSFQPSEIPASSKIEVTATENEQGKDPRYPAIDSERGVIYINTHSYLYALDLATGLERWKFAFQEIEPAADDYYSYYNMPSPVIGDDGTIYIGHSNYLAAINPDSTGKWFFKTKGSIAASVTVDDKAVHLGDTSGAFYVISKDDASILGSYQTQGEILNAPILAGDGTSYFESRDGNIYAVSPEGALKWVYGTKQCYEILSGSSLSQGKLYVAIGNSILIFGQNSENTSAAPDHHSFINLLFE